MVAEARRTGGRAGRGARGARSRVASGVPPASPPASPPDRLPARLHVVLISPQIPPNTGSIARLCAATDTPLHLIEPLGFAIDDRHVRRAGLDYWDKVDLWVHSGWPDFRDAIARERCLYFSANATRDLSEARFRPNSCLIFGNETDGMPTRILEKHPRYCFRIPMPGQVRSLNLANAVSVVLYEGLRRLGLAVPAEPLLPADCGD